MTKLPDPSKTKPPMTLEEWEASQPLYPRPRPPRWVASHIYKGDPIKPRASLFAPYKKYVRPDWVSIFREAAKARQAALEAEAAEAAKADDAEKS